MGEFFTALIGNIPAVICLVAGVIFIAVEIITPGFGLPGISGTVLLVAGVILGARSVTEGLLMMLVLIIILCALAASVIRSASTGRISRTPLILTEEMSRDMGYSSSRDMDYFLGKKGITLTALRPAGLADFEGVKLDVVADGTFIEKDEQIRITEIEGRRIVVKKI